MASAQARQQLPLRTPPSAWGTACPPLCAVRGAPDDVLLGPGPSLQILRRRFPALVRTLRGYYGPVRLLGGVRVGRAAVAFPHRPATSRQAPPRSPGSRAGSFLTCTGSPTAPGSSAASDSAAVDMAFPFCPQGRHPNLGISRLNRRPASASVNASPAMSPSPAHDSRSAWFATPSLWGSFIPNSPPVYPGAFGQLPNLGVRPRRTAISAAGRAVCAAAIVLPAAPVPPRNGHLQTDFRNESPPESRLLGPLRRPAPRPSRSRNKFRSSPRNQVFPMGPLPRHGPARSTTGTPQPARPVRREPGSSPRTAAPAPGASGLKDTNKSGSATNAPSSGNAG